MWPIKPFFFFGEKPRSIERVIPSSNFTRLWLSQEAALYCTLKHLRRSVLNDLSFGVQLTFHKQLIFFIKRNKMLSICIQYIRMQRPEALEGRELSCQENFCYKHTFTEMQHISSTCILFSRKEKNGEQLIYFDMDTRHESTQVNINKLSLFPLWQKLK